MAGVPFEPDARALFFRSVMEGTEQGMQTEVAPPAGTAPAEACADRFAGLDEGPAGDRGAGTAAAGADEYVIVLRSDRPHVLHARSDDAAIGAMLRRLYDVGMAARLKPSELTVYLALATRANTNHFRATGELVCWPEEPALMARTGLGRSILYRATGRLRTLGMVRRVKVKVEWREDLQNGYLVIEPEAPDRLERNEPMDIRQSTTVDSGARASGRSSPLARARKSTGVDGSVHCSGLKQSTVVDSPLFDSLVKETGKNETAAEPAAALAARGEREQVVRALRAAGINSARSIDRLADMPTSTPQRVDAAIALARKRKPDRLAAYVVYLLQNPQFVQVFEPRPVPAGGGAAPPREDSAALARKVEEERAEEERELAGLSPAELEGARRAAIASAPTPRIGAEWDKLDPLTCTNVFFRGAVLGCARVARRRAENGREAQ